MDIEDIKIIEGTGTVIKNLFKAQKYRIIMVHIKFFAFPVSS